MFPSSASSYGRKRLRCRWPFSTRPEQLPVKLNHVVAFSVPVSFRETMQRLDQFENLPYSYDTIVPIVKSAKPNSRVPSDTSTEMLEKVIGRGFRLDLGEAVNNIDQLYSSRIHPSPAAELGFENLGNAHAPRMEREIDSGAVNFGALFHYWIARYWQSRGEVKSEDELLNYGELALLLPQLGNNVEVVLAASDPLNAPGATSELEKIQTERARHRRPRQRWTRGHSVRDCGTGTLDREPHLCELRRRRGASRERLKH